MANVKKIGMAIGTFGVALGIGFVMQNGDVVASRFGADADVAQPARFTDDIEQVRSSAVQVSGPIESTTIQGSMLSSTSPAISTPDLDINAKVTLPDVARVQPSQDAPIQFAALDPEPAPVIQSDASLTADVDCSPAMAGAPSVAATVLVSIAAPCHANALFTIHHQGMMFSALTDANGNADVTVPGLAEVAVLIAAFEDGTGAVTTTVLPDFSSYDRAVLQWQGDTAVLLSAYENDAGFGDTSHIHANNPGNISRMTDEQGGYLVRLGDSSVADALLAEVYTFPSGMTTRASDVMIVAEAEITSANCGKELNAQSIQISPNGTTSALDLTMVMPDCDAVGDFLVLQNMFEDLTIAAR